MTCPLITLCLLVAAAPSGAEEAAGSRTATRPPNRWERDIQRFERQDQSHPPAPGGILFVGSSSIVRWELKEYFPGLPTINRGFGGSQLSDVVHFAERIVLPYRPRIIVLYAGDNDLAAGKRWQDVLADFRRFVTKVHRALPKTRIVYVAIKPSLRRWQLIEQIRQANAGIKEVVEDDPRLRFVDVDRPMIAADGKPREELFAPDGLHLSAAGYRLWSKLLRPELD